MAADGFYAIAQAIRDEYPGLYPYLKVDPEVTRAIFQVFKEGAPGATKLQQAIWETDWYKNTPATKRERLILKIEDPAEWARQTKQQSSLLKMQMEQLGLRIGGKTPQGRGSTVGGKPLNDFTIALFAEKGLQEGWTEEQTRWHLFSRLTPGDFAIPGDIYSYQRPGGQFGEAIANVEARARDFGIGLTEKRMFDLARTQFAGTGSAEGLDDGLRKMARSKFQAKAVQDALDQGLTVREFADPYLAQAAQELDLNPNEIDLLDTKWTEPLKYQDTDGERVMNLAEWQKHYRNDDRYGFNTSSTAREEAANFQARILEQFGAR